MKLDFEKYADGLIPAIVQDAKTNKVLMLGFMNQESFALTQKDKRVTFYSRSRQKLWTKGETSGNFLEVEEILIDCDSDSILVKANPLGPVCHTGSDTCFEEVNRPDNILFELERVIEERMENRTESSYTSRLFEEGRNRIAKKVGEEAVELVIEAVGKNDELFKEEASDLLYHFIVMLVDRNIKFEEVMEVLRQRKR